MHLFRSVTLLPRIWHRRFNNESYVSVHSSTIPQEPNEFTKIFKSYADEST